MDENKPHVYRLSTEVETPGQNVRKMFEDELQVKRDAVIAATMRGRDDALRRFEEQEAATRQADLDNLKSVWTPLDYSSLFSSLDLGNVAAALASANAQYAQAVQAQQATTRQMLEVQEMAQGAFAELAHFAVSARSGLDFFIRRYEEEEREACETLGIDIDDPFYADMELGQFWAEVEAVRWMKEMVRQGRMQTSEAKAGFEGLLRTGQLSGYTLSRFIHLVIDTPVAANSLWIPDNHEFEIQVSDPVSGISQSRTIMTAGKRGAIVSVRYAGIATDSWRVAVPGRLTTSQEAETKIAEAPNYKNEVWRSLSPDLQHWYYIVLQSEYERTNHANTYTAFCLRNGLSYDTYKTNKGKLNDVPDFNPVAWVTDGKPGDAHKKVIRAIETKRASGWTEPPDVHL